MAKFKRSSEVCEYRKIDADPTNDYVSVMDLVEADPANPGRWIPDADAISEVAAEYQD